MGGKERKGNEREVEEGRNEEWQFGTERIIHLASEYSSYSPVRRAMCSFLPRSEKRTIRGKKRRWRRWKRWRKKRRMRFSMRYILTRLCV